MRRLLKEVIIARTGKLLRVVAVLLSVFFYISMREGGRSSSQQPPSLFCREPHLPPSYKVCNGLANQLLGHAAYISHSIQTQSLVRIPDVFIMNGVQNEVDAKRGLKTVFPNKKNSVPLSMIIDTNKLLHMIESHGTQACFVPYEEVVLFNDQANSDECPWLYQLKKSENNLSLEILNAMHPSRSMLRLVENMFDNLTNRLRESNLSPSYGICLHHRNGLDWKNHCRIWNGNNCLESEGRSVADLVHERIPATQQKKWIYYISDVAPDEKLILEFERYGLKIIHRDRHQLLTNNVPEVLGIDRTREKYRDIMAAMDFFLCERIDSFIGNSVSTFSAVQIAKRMGKNSSWYNSRSIPLAPMLDVYLIPIIYTYTELSQEVGMHLLKTSILSARKVFGMRTDIHVIYHGSRDTKFLNWLKGHDVILHHHFPKWSSAIEEMRINSNTRQQSQSHLFRHSGNYFGTWQRIDIPLFVNAEYALFLDSDTIIHSKITLADFGPDITRGIALSSEFSETTLLPSNAGIALLNIPKLRKTHDSFIGFILNHSASHFLMGPSDQGAYLDYYGDAQNASNTNQFYRNLASQKDNATLSYLDNKFNFKPYYRQEKHMKNRKITHFHGLKPHDILSFLLGKSASEFPPVMEPLLSKMADKKCAQSICAAMRDFGGAILLEKDQLKSYCDATISFNGSYNSSGFCSFFFALVVLVPGIDCMYLGHLWRQPGGRLEMSSALKDLEAALSYEHLFIQ